MGGKVEAGDTVAARGSDWVVIDVAQDEDGRWCILRDADDLASEHPLAVREEEATITGHVEAVPGWTEVQHGEWVKAE